MGTAIILAGSATAMAAGEFLSHESLRSVVGTLVVSASDMEHQFETGPALGVIAA
jgi:hypothetical protein